MQINVSVTADHLANGVRRNCRQCPVALALREAFPFPELDIQVAPTAIWVEMPNQLLSLVRIELPWTVTRLIAQYDARLAQQGPVQPFSFTVDVPDILVPYLNPSLGKK